MKFKAGVGVVARIRTYQLDSSVAQSRVPLSLSAGRTMDSAGSSEVPIAGSIPARQSNSAAAFDARSVELAFIGKTTLSSFQDVIVAQYLIPLKVPPPTA